MVNLDFLCQIHEKPLGFGAPLRLSVYCKVQYNGELSLEEYTGLKHT